MRQTGRAAADYEDAFDAVVAETLAKDGLTNHPGRAEENHPHGVTLSEELLPDRADERRVTQLQSHRIGRLRIGARQVPKLILPVRRGLENDLGDLVGSRIRLHLFRVR